MSITDIPGLILPRQAFLEEEEAAVEYLPMPADMSTYHAPVTPEVEDIDQYPRVLETMHALVAGFTQASATSNFNLPLDHLNEHELRLVDQFLGEGEVSIVIEGQRRCQIQESVLTGVWRLHESTESQQQVSVEIGAIPHCVKQANALDTEVLIDDDNAAGLMNARPIMAEVLERNRCFVPASQAHVINLSLLPVNEADQQWLVEKLGYGGVTILSRGYGNCRITRTQLQHAWWVQYFNSMDTLILNTLEITEIPEVACAAAEDISASHARLQVMLEVYD